MTEVKTKSEIRKEALAIRKRTAALILEQKSGVILKRLMGLPEWKAANEVFVFISLPDEVQTKELVVAAWKEGKVVCAPRVNGKDMDFIRFDSRDELAEGPHHILEPTGDEIHTTENALLIVPGVVFDIARHRIGFGGGYYDRYLAAHPGHPTVALTYDFNVYPEIPHEAHDIRPDVLVTEKGIIRGEEEVMNTVEKTGEDRLIQIGRGAKEASRVLAKLGTDKKNEVLERAAKELIYQSDSILSANEKDRARAIEKGMSAGLLDRLTLTEERIGGMAEGLRAVAALDDPIGEIQNMKRRPNGLLIGRMTVPLGVIGVIYEARPNVTSDVFALCFKTGNATILKGGSDAIESNKAITAALQAALAAAGVPETSLQLIEDTSRETTKAFMHLDEYVDLLIPRGGAGLIRTVVKESTIPVIQTGTGNCHVYVDEGADVQMAVRIITNAKTQRVGVCNAEESLIVHESIREALLPALEKELKKSNVELRADAEAAQFLKDSVPATEEDWGTEYLDYILSIKTVSGLEEAIDHINRYNTGHSECIVTENYEHAQRFLRDVDAAAVYVNASTRFTDGYEFGFGAEIGISTQKLHARGPMGLPALTSYKYVIYGSGQIRG